MLKVLHSFAKTGEQKVPIYIQCEAPLGGKHNKKRRGETPRASVFVFLRLTRSFSPRMISPSHTPPNDRLVGGGGYTAAPLQGFSRITTQYNKGGIKEAYPLRWL